MRHTNFKKLILVLGIVIIFNLFINYGVATFYDKPEYKDFCDREEFSPKPLPLMEQRDGEDFDSEAYEERQKAQKECNEKYQAVNDLYKRNVFIILITAGIISIVIGFLIVQVEAVSLGLSFGGLISLIIGTIRYWSAMDDYLRFVILGIALIILIWIGIKKFRNE